MGGCLQACVFGRDEIVDVFTLPLFVSEWPGVDGGASVRFLQPTVGGV